MFSVVNYHGRYAVIEEERRTTTRVYIKRAVEGRMYGTGFINQSYVVGSFRDEAKAVAAFAVISDLDERHRSEYLELLNRHRAEFAATIRTLALQEPSEAVAAI